MNRLIKAVGGMLLAATLAACGGGGGSAGTTTTGTGSTGTTGTTDTGTTQTTAAGQISLDVLNASSASSSTFGGSEQARAVATVTGPTGAPVPGVIVLFAQENASLLSFAPASGTALTDSTGKAAIDVKATDPTVGGAVSVTAQVLLGTTTLSAKKGIQINGSTATSPVAVAPTSMLFLDASPTSIVIKGAGGQGRSESSTLRFKVVDASNAPIRGAVVNFAVSSGGVTLNIPQATSDGEGVVVTTVTSGTQATSVVVTATAAANSNATVPSSTLSVSNGLTVAGGLEVVAAQYNIDGGITGTETTVSAFMRDVNGNLVPDGTIVSFTTDFGAVGSSSAGSCSSLNGTCTVQFRVQEPRGTGLATVRATVQLPGNATALTTSVAINMALSAGAHALSALPGTTATTLTLSGTCKKAFTLFAADGRNRAVAAGTTIGTQSARDGVTVAIASGTPVLDVLSAAKTPPSFDVNVDATTATPVCNATGVSTQTTSFELRFTSPGGVVTTHLLNIVYPI